MRITIEIDDKLLKEALALTKAKTKKELIHRSLEALIRQKRIERLLGRVSRFPLSFDRTWDEVGRSLRRAGVRTASDVNQLVRAVPATKGGTGKRARTR